MSDTTNNRLEIVQTRIDQYGMRFPVATIAKETKLDKGYVSAILSGKKPVSDNFWSTFNEVFPEKNGTGDDAPMQKIVLDVNILIELLRSSQEEKKRLLDVIDANLTTLVSTQQVILGHVKASHKWEATKHGKGSAQKQEAILEQLNKFADEYVPDGAGAYKSVPKSK
jgi:hypothetical protein